MEKIIKTLILSFTILFLGGCVKDDISPELSQTFTDYTDYPTGLSGLSGLALAPNGEYLYAVCDNGKLYKLSFNGVVLEEVFSSENDFEAVSVQKKSGEIYLADEGNMTVWHLNVNTLEKVVKIEIPNAVVNKGLEGLTCCGDNSLYIANQESPTEIFKYDLANNKIDKKIAISFASFLSDICYDDYDNSIWILDSKAKKLYHCDIDCNLKETFSVSFVTKAEALAVDRANGIIWIGCDQTSLLYKVNINNLKK